VVIANKIVEIENTNSEYGAVGTHAQVENGENAHKLQRSQQHK